MFEEIEDEYKPTFDLLHIAIRGEAFVGSLLAKNAKHSPSIICRAERERANLVVRLARFFYVYRVNNQFTDTSINGRLYLEKRCCSAYNSSISTSMYCPGTCTAKMSCRLQTSATL